MIYTCVNCGDVVEKEVVWMMALKMLCHRRFQTFDHRPRAFFGPRELTPGRIEIVPTSLAVCGPVYQDGDKHQLKP